MKTKAGYFAIGVLLMGAPRPQDELPAYFLYLPAIPYVGHCEPITYPVYTESVATDDMPGFQVVETDLIARLKQIFRAEGVPSALVWLAEIESAFDYRARSRAGAVGMFQFMPETAERFGLTVSGEVDDRLNPAKSAAAAARYLRVLHQEFGSWRLAVASYNAGEGQVRRLLWDHQASTYRAIERYLPYETQDYVDRVFNMIGLREGLIARADAPFPRS